MALELDFIFIMLSLSRLALFFSFTLLHSLSFHSSALFFFCLSLILFGNLLLLFLPALAPSLPCILLLVVFAQKVSTTFLCLDSTARHRRNFTASWIIT